VPVPTERWFIVLGVVLGLYGSVVAGAAGAGHLAAEIVRRLERLMAPVRMRTQATKQWLKQRLRRRRSIQIRSGATSSSAVGMSTLHGSPLPHVDFLLWRDSASPAEQRAALVERTERLRQWVNQNIDDISSMRNGVATLNRQVDRLAKSFHGETRAEVAKLEARSMRVSAAGLPGIALSILLTGIPSMLLPPGSWAWATFGVFVALAVVYVMWTWRGAFAAILEGWRITQPSMATG
jgi:ribosomal protein S15P/S13E